MRQWKYIKNAKKDLYSLHPRQDIFILYDFTKFNAIQRRIYILHYYYATQLNEQYNFVVLFLVFLSSIIVLRNKKNYTHV